MRLGAGLSRCWWKTTRFNHCQQPIRKSDWTLVLPVWLLLAMGLMLLILSILNGCVASLDLTFPDKSANADGVEVLAINASIR
nr:hypothetical protein [Chroococcidiopsis sp. CCMEE 29]